MFKPKPRSPGGMNLPAPRFEAQSEPHAQDRTPYYDARIMAGAEIPDFAILAPRELAALSAAYRLLAIMCDATALRPRPTRPAVSARMWAEKWACDGLTARLAAQCCDSRLKARRRPA